MLGAGLLTRAEGCLARVLGKATAETVRVQNSAQQQTA